MNWIEPFVWLVVVVSAIPLLVLTLECLAAGRKPSCPARNGNLARPRCAVLIPAHNEEAVLARTLQTLAPQLDPNDRVLVVADNCTDQTAALARKHGAEVVERTDATRRGKGFALAFGVDCLRASPPEVLLILDADCVVGEKAVGRLVEEAAVQRRPVQAAYRMDPPPGAGPEKRLAGFAFLVKNVVRPSGLWRFGQPCLLTGTGMAFPWEVIRDVRLGHGHIVEDMQLTVDLALAGSPPTFVQDAEVRAEFPVSRQATASQRRRWEHGHLQVSLSAVPKLLAAGLIRRRSRLLALALELSIPPLTALFLGSITALFILICWALVSGMWSPAIVLGVIGTGAIFGLTVTWKRFGREILPLTDVAQMPLYIIRKIPLYFGFFLQRQAEWVRTPRN